MPRYIRSVETIVERDLGTAVERDPGTAADVAAVAPVAAAEAGTVGGGIHSPRFQLVRTAVADTSAAAAAAPIASPRMSPFG